MKTLSQSRGRVTLRAVASRARVSVVTASRALNNHPLVAAATHKRVLRASAALGYVPNLLARGLVTDRTRTVGVILLELANPFFAELVSGIQAMAAKREYLVVIGESGRSAEEERRCLAQFQQFRIGGLLITPVESRLDHLLAARGAGTPTVVMGRRWPAGDFVSADDVEGGRLAARHILTREHRRVAIVRRGDPHHRPGHDIFTGFRAVLSKAGVALRDDWDIRVADGQVTDGIRAADALLTQRQRPTAVFATSDRLAVGLVHGFHARGVRVPEDVGVVGYDNIPWGEYCRVPLTTVAVPKRGVGEVAAGLLFDRHDTDDVERPRQILLPPDLVIRASLP